MSVPRKGGKPSDVKLASSRKDEGGQSERTEGF